MKKVPFRGVNIVRTPITGWSVFLTADPEGFPWYAGADPGSGKGGHLAIFRPVVDCGSTLKQHWANATCLLKVYSKPSDGLVLGQRGR